MEYFPNLSENELDLKSQNLAIRTFGRRLYSDQTVNEYLTEFLLVFIGKSEKGSEITSKDGFNKITEYYNKEVLRNEGIYEFDNIIEYSVFPDIGLRRFIFLQNSKISSQSKVDLCANTELNNQLLKAINGEGEVTLEMLRSFLYGFVSVSKNRGWFAKTLLPMCRENIFPEAMGLKKDRNKLKFSEVFNDNNNKFKLDTKFGWKQYNFQARGGEVYYLHLLNGMKQLLNEDEKNGKKIIANIDSKLKHLLNSFKQISDLSKFISNTWLDYYLKQLNCDNDRKKIMEELEITKKAQWIIVQNPLISKNSVLELSNLLDNSTSEFEKFDLLATCISFQIIRKMMVDIGIQCKEELAFVFHVSSNEIHDAKIKKNAQIKFKRNEELFQIVMGDNLKLMNDYKENNIKKNDESILKEGYNHSHKLVRKLGKELDIIRPKKGPGMRFVFSKNLVKFLVLTFVQPGKSITLDTFFEKIYDSYKIIVREEEYYKHYGEPANVLNHNAHEFQLLLKENGFLKELSDAVSIVENPYVRLEAK